MSTSTKVDVVAVDNDESPCRSPSRLLRASGMQPTCYLSAEDFLADPAQPWFDCLVLDIQFGRKAARFFQVENQINLALDLRVAASLPLIK